MLPERDSLEQAREFFCNKLKTEPRQCGQREAKLAVKQHEEKCFEVSGMFAVHYL
jgi:hypothetical protein